MMVISDTSTTLLVTISRDVHCQVPCGLSLMVDFMTNGNNVSTLDTSCVAQISPLDFAGTNPRNSALRRMVFGTDDIWAFDGPQLPPVFAPVQPHPTCEPAASEKKLTLAMVGAFVVGAGLSWCASYLLNKRSRDGQARLLNGDGHGYGAMQI
jgi:hypothetical protein